MKIKHLQLNTSTLKDPVNVMKYIKDNQIDIACLQEIDYPSGKDNPLINILGKDFNYSEGINYYSKSTNEFSSLCIISKFPIVDEIRLFYNTPNYLPKIIKKEDEFSNSNLRDNSNEMFPNSRGLTLSIKSRCILSNLLKTPSGLIRVITVHFNVSDLCTETNKMYEISQYIYSLISNSKDYPTILSGDLNIRVNSYSVSKIKEVLTCHSENLKDTLSANHISKKDYPEGLAIDHVFSKGLKHIFTNTKEIDFSDHKALISEFEI